MQSPEFFESLSRALRAQRIGTDAAERFKAELFDHLQCAIEEGRQRGEYPEKAEAAAIAALGAPADLAGAAAEAWRSGLWQNRHPWLLSLVMALGAIFTPYLLLFLASELAQFAGAGHHLKPGSPAIPFMILLCNLANWLPAIAGGLWLALESRSRRLRSRTFWIACSVLALAVSSYNSQIHPPTLHSHGSINMTAGPVLAVLVWPVAILLNFDKALGYGHTNWFWLLLPNSVLFWLQFTLPFVIALVMASRQIFASDWEPPSRIDA